MATIRVHEDQENRISDVRRGKENINVPLQNQTLQPTKRAVLGVLHNNCNRNTKSVCIDFLFFLPRFCSLKNLMLFLMIIFNDYLYYNYF